MLGELIQQRVYDLETDRSDPGFYTSDWSDSKDDLDSADWEEALEPEGMNEESDEPFDMADEMDKDDYDDVTPGTPD